MRGRNEKSKHGGKEHREPAHGWHDGNAASPQWNSDTQSVYPPESTPRSSPLDDLSSSIANYHIGEAGPVTDPTYYPSSTDPNQALDYQSSPSTSYSNASYSYGSPPGHMPDDISMAQPYGNNTGGNVYSNTDGSWPDNSSYGLTETPQHHGHHGKGKEVSYDEGTTNNSTGAYHSQGAYTAGASSGTGLASGSGGTSASAHYNYHPNGFEAMGGMADEESDDEEDNEAEDEEDEGEDEGAYYGDGGLAQAMEDSRRGAYYGHDPGAGSSTAASAYAPGESYPPVDLQLRADDFQLQASLPSTMPNIGPLEVEEDSSMGLDARSFSVVPSYHYQPGSVFKMLWSEPRGKHGALPTEVTLSHEDNFYFCVRRFVIIATDRAHHSTCVPILTYEHRACTKPGVQPGVHGIIYSQGRRPGKVTGEKDLGYRPVSCTMYPHEALVKESRVNYSKLVTIEHNVEVKFIGTITEGDFAIVQDAVDDCWRKKNRQANRDSKSKSKSSKHSKSKSSKTESESKHKSSSSKTSSDKKHSKRSH
ncbi:uncharacterized protein PG986_001685 [Apiospora aurea]|uniref:DUF6590 domain-containing protein n=1 Tax=Apiospora aurea TaxID=335848 RepID=A0ABR1QXM1_9PEZI